MVTHDLSEAVSVADRILILTKRPAQIKTTISVSFPDNANSPLLRRNCPEFSSYFNDVWNSLREGGAS